MGTIFWDEDTQNDFIKKDGKLSIEGAEAILDNLEKLTRYARQRGIQIVASVCDHTLEDDEISDQPDFEQTYPPHCIRGTEGQQNVYQTKPQNPLFITSESRREELKERLDRHTGEIVIKKNDFDVFSNPSTATVLEILEPDKIIVYGVALDVCVRCVVEGFLQRSQGQVILVQDATRAIREEQRAPLLADWTKRGVKIVSTEEILTEG